MDIQLKTYMKKIIILSFLGVLFSLAGCSSLEEKKNGKTAREFYEVYANRENVDKLMEFYSSSDPQWIDAVAQSVVEGRENIKNRYQYEWSDEKYKKHMSYPKAVQIETLLANDSIVAVSGKYNPYYYNGNLVNEMKFTSWLYFDKEGKIKKQIEWVQYSVGDLQDIINFKQTAEIH